MWVAHHPRLGKGLERGHMMCLSHLPRIITFYDTVEFTYTEEYVRSRKNLIGKGRVRGHMMWLAHHTRICPGKESARTHDVSAAPPLDLYRLFNKVVVVPGIVGSDAKAMGPRPAQHLSGPRGDTA